MIEMKLAIMQPYFFPYIGYWQLLYAVEQYVIYDDVNYIKGGWINRNRILLDGNAHYWGLRLSGASSMKKINEIEIFNDEIYRGKLVKTLRDAYHRAPFFHDVFPLIEELILSKETRLSIYLENCIGCICDYLDITTKIIVSSSINKDKTLSGQDKVLCICHTLQANKYINAIGGKKLYDEKEFSKHGVELSFLQPETEAYRQYTDCFVPNLSLIDTLMFCGKEKTKKMLCQYRLTN